MGEELKEFDIHNVEYPDRYMTQDGIRWVMVKEINANVLPQIEALEAELEALRCPWVSVDERSDEIKYYDLCIYDPDFGLGEPDHYIFVRLLVECRSTMLRWSTRLC